MADDHEEDSVLIKYGKGCEDDIVEAWLDREAKAHGYENWIVAYHVINRPSTTDWSHSDGDAPWNPNYRTPLGPLSFADDREYEPEERIRGQFK